MSVLIIALSGALSYVCEEHCSARFCLQDENLIWYDYER